jgi:hypothetical protein
MSNARQASCLHRQVDRFRDRFHAMTSLFDRYVKEKDTLLSGSAWFFTSLEQLLRGECLLESSAFKPMMRFVASRGDDAYFLGK